MFFPPKLCITLITLLTPSGPFDLTDEELLVLASPETAEWLLTEDLAEDLAEDFSEVFPEFTLYELLDGLDIFEWVLSFSWVTFTNENSPDGYGKTYGSADRS